MRLLHFILSHSVFIACCAAALCLQTDLLLHLPRDSRFYFFIFFATLCSYNLYWLLSKFYFSRRLSQGFLKENLSFIFTLICAAAGMIVFSSSVIQILPYTCMAAGLMLLYSLPLWPFSFSRRLQKAGFLKTILLAFAWAFVTVALPAARYAQSFDTSFYYLLTARFSFMLVLCIIFDSRDAAIDKMRGIHSLATDVTYRTLRLCGFFAFVAFCAGGVLLRIQTAGALQIIAFTVTAYLVWIVYKSSLRKQGYVFYYFVVDGLMIASTALTYAASFRHIH